MILRAISSLMAMRASLTFTMTFPPWAATTVTVDVVVMHGYAAGASALRRLMRSARAVRAQNRVFGGLLMAVGAGLFFVKRGGQHA